MRISYPLWDIIENVSIEGDQGYVHNIFISTFNRWGNEVGDPHFLRERSVLNIFMYHWKFVFGELKNKRRRLKIHVWVNDVVTPYIQKRLRMREKIGKVPH